MSKPKKQHSRTPSSKPKETGAFAGLAVTQPDTRDTATGAPIPSDAHVEQAREWVQENEK